MSVKWIAWAWEQDVKPGPKLTLIALADHAGETGECWPSTGRLSEKTGHSRATVFTHLQQLEAAGVIWREARFREDGSQSASIVHLVPPYQESGRGGIQNLDGGYPESGPLSNEPSNEPSVRTARVDVVDFRFEHFWGAYPRKVGKPRAEAVWGKLMKAGQDSNEIMEGLGPWIDYWRERGEPEYIPHPTTWLNRRGWEDEPPTNGSKRKTDPVIDHLRRRMNDQ